ncbi:MAG TPA: ROK family protein, partial [Citricoccus sp.]
MGDTVGGEAPVATAIGLDVGGGALKAGVLLIDRHGTPFPDGAPRTVDHGLGADGPALVALCARTARDLAADLERRWPTLPPAWGVSAAAWIDPRTGESVFSPHLPGWRGRQLPAELSRELSRATGRPLSPDGGARPSPGSVATPSVVNDADAAAWAEARLAAAPAGADRPDRMVLVAIGTGIGGALVQDGAVDLGAHGMAGEYGHMTVDPSRGPCPCGNSGCWELLVSAAALARRAGDESARQVLDRALSGDRRSLEAVRQTGRWLGRGLATLAAVLDPSRFVIGGGLSVAGDLLLEPARAELLRHLPGGRHRPVPGVAAAALGNDAGWSGAAGIAL